MKFVSQLLLLLLLHSGKAKTIHTVFCWIILKVENCTNLLNSCWRLVAALEIFSCFPVPEAHDSSILRCLARQRVHLLFVLISVTKAPCHGTWSHPPRTHHHHHHLAGSRTYSPLHGCHVSHNSALATPPPHRAGAAPGYSSKPRLSLRPLSPVPPRQHHPAVLPPSLLWGSRLRHLSWYR